MQSTEFFVIATDLYPEGSEFHTYICPASEDIRTGPAPQCPTCGGFLGAIPWLPPYTVTVELSGKGYGDWAIGPGSDYFVSDRLRQLILDNGISGFDRFDKVVVSKTVRKKKLPVGERAPIYYKTMIRWSRSALDQKRSGIEWDSARICPDCRQGNLVKRWRAVVLENGPAVAEDVFIPRGLYVVMASLRFQQLCANAGMKNLVFVKAEEYSSDF